MSAIENVKTYIAEWDHYRNVERDGSAPDDSVATGLNNVRITLGDLRELVRIAERVDDSRVETRLIYRGAPMLGTPVADVDAAREYIESSVSAHVYYAHCDGPADAEAYAAKHRAKFRIEQRVVASSATGWTEVSA